jgi:membrane protein
MTGHHHHPGRLLLRSIRDFYRDRGPTHAASLAFFFIVAMVPLLMCTLTVLGYLLGGSREFFSYFVDELLSFFPSITVEITDELRKVVMYKNIGVLGIAVYAIVSFQLYRAMHIAIQTIFKVTDKRPLYVDILYSLLVVSIFVFLMFVSFSVSTMVPLIQAADKYVPIIKLGPATVVMMRYILPLFLVMFTSIFMYIVLPKRFIRFYHAFWGGLFTAIILEAAKHLFTWYVKKVHTLGLTYGSLTTFVVFLLWVYFSSSVFLIGGEIVHNLSEPLPTTPRRRVSDTKKNASRSVSKQ